jgi:hypothetical protein
VPVIGYLGTQSAEVDYKNITVPFLQGLKKTGYVEDQNVAIEFRWAENQFDRLPALAADLVRRRVAVILAPGAAAARAAKAATTTIPIVFNTAVDPVAMGLVASLNRPGANVTGSTILSIELGPKRLQLLHELIPNAAAFGVLVESQSIITDLQAAARTLGLQLVVANARTDSSPVSSSVVMMICCANSAPVVWRLPTARHRKCAAVRVHARHDAAGVTENRGALGSGHWYFPKKTPGVTGRKFASGGFNSGGQWPLHSPSSRAAVASSGFRFGAAIGCSGSDPMISTSSISSDV